jgi:hypothetical protein
VVKGLISRDAGGALALTDRGRVDAWCVASSLGGTPGKGMLIRPSDRWSLNRSLAPIGELDGIAHKVEQHLRDAPLVAAADREIGQDVEPEAKLLLSRESTAVTTPCTTSPSE